MSLSAPKVAAPIVPAKRVERTESAAPEDVILGGADELESDVTDKKGKRSLSRPTSGLAV